MPHTRLSQIGIGVQAYETPIDVDLSTADWGWTAYPVTVEYETAPATRLGQIAIGVASYPPEAESVGENIILTPDSWGWTSYPIDIPGENFYLTPNSWGWQPFSPTICSQSNFGYAYSFNENVWPTCTYNDYKYGPRTASEFDLKVDQWGWQNFDITVDFQDPINVDLNLDNWGWTSLPVGISYGYDIGLQIASWGWQPFNVTVELPYDIDLSATDWGWTPLPVGVSYGYDIGLTIASWGWTSYPVTVDVPSFDIGLRKQDWGWESFPVTVQQTTLQPGDIQAIADAVYQKLVDEGVIQQILETWQRTGCDPSYPQTYAPESITCGNIDIKIDTRAGKTTQTRQ